MALRFFFRLSWDVGMLPTPRRVDKGLILARVNSVLNYACVDVEDSSKWRASHANLCALKFNPFPPSFDNPPRAPLVNAPVQCQHFEFEKNGMTGKIRHQRRRASIQALPSA